MHSKRPFGIHVTLIVLTGLALIGWAAIDKPFLRLRAGRDEALITVVVPPHPDHRWLAVTGAVVSAEGDVVWERTTWEQMDGDRAPLSRTIPWRLPRANPSEEGARVLHVRASVICETADGQAYIP